MKALKDNVGNTFFFNIFFIWLHWVFTGTCEIFPCGEQVPEHRLSNCSAVEGKLPHGLLGT